MATAGERWPPVYDFDSLIREIRRLTTHADIATEFYEWRRDRSTEVPADVCQGDVVWLPSDVPVILEDGLPSAMEHPDEAWLVVGNTCDFSRSLEEAQWTQLVPVMSIGTVSDIDGAGLAALRQYTQSRRFFVPPWSSRVDGQVYVADFLRPVGVDKRALQGVSPAGAVQARMSRAAWILLNACLVRFLARDDGRYD